MLKRYFFQAITLFALTVIQIPATAKTFKVVIDPGHGGKDPGCIGATGMKEKDINLTIALKVGRLIESNHKDVKVIYTRSTDVFIPLDQRPEIANRNKADLFISIHGNAVPKKNAATAFGTETFTLGTSRSADNLEVAKRENAVILLEDDYQTRYQGFDPNSAESYIMFETLQGTHQTQSIQLASLIQDEFRVRAKRHDRQVRQAGLLVLRTASMPAILTEIGFLSNRDEERFLATEEGKNKISASIYHGFRNYKEAYDRHNGISTVQLDNNTLKDKTEKDEIKRQQPVQAKPIQTANTKTTATKTASTGNRATQTGQTVYKVQFLSYHKKLNKGAAQLKGLWPVDYTIEKGTYRYTYGSSTDFNQITRIQKQVRTKFKDAFVVRYKNGERTSK